MALPDLAWNSQPVLQSGSQQTGPLPGARRERLKRLAMIIGIGVGAGMMVAVALVRLLENRFIYFPPRYPAGFVPPQRYGLQVEEVWITAVDGIKLNAYFLPHVASSKVLLWFHGNAENIGFGLEQMKALATLDLNILELDYRGYGKSEDHLTRLGSTATPMPRIAILRTRDTSSPRTSFCTAIHWAAR